MAEGGGLLNRCTVSSRTVSSNVIPSASFCHPTSVYRAILAFETRDCTCAVSAVKGRCRGAQQYPKGKGMVRSRERSGAEGG